MIWSSMKLLMVSIIIILKLFVITSIYANPLEIEIDESNVLPDGKNYATVSLSYIYDGVKRGVRIAVEVDESILVPCNNFGVQRFGFNTTIKDPANNLKITLPPAGIVDLFQLFLPSPIITFFLLCVVYLTGYKLPYIITVHLVVLKLIIALWGVAESIHLL